MMSNKLINISLIGGEHNGEIIENFPVNRLPPSFSFKDDLFFATNPSGGIDIMKGKLNEFWHSYSVVVYLKGPLKEDTDDVEYKFIEERMVERCSALTNKGRQCLKPAVNSQSFCTTHSRKN